ncbi:hypothetical protein P7K49_029120, partial [Saguinus oedipus]
MHFQRRGPRNLLAPGLAQGHREPERELEDPPTGARRHWRTGFCLSLLQAEQPRALFSPSGLGARITQPPASWPNSGSFSPFLDGSSSATPVSPG